MTKRERNRFNTLAVTPPCTNTFSCYTFQRITKNSEAPPPSCAGSHKALLLCPVVLQAPILSHGILQAVLVESPCMLHVIEKVPESSREGVN